MPPALNARWHAFLLASGGPCRKFLWFRNALS